MLGCRLGGFWHRPFMITQRCRELAPPLSHSALWGGNVTAGAGGHAARARKDAPWSLGLGGEGGRDGRRGGPGDLAFTGGEHLERLDLLLLPVPGHSFGVQDEGRNGGEFDLKGAGETWAGEEWRAWPAHREASLPCPVALRSSDGPMPETRTGRLHAGPHTEVAWTAWASAPGIAMRVPGAHLGDAADDVGVLPGIVFLIPAEDLHLPAFQEVDL